MEDEYKEFRHKGELFRVYQVQSGLTSILRVNPPIGATKWAVVHAEHDYGWLRVVCGDTLQITTDVQDAVGRACDELLARPYTRSDPNVKQAELTSWYEGLE